MFWVEKAAQHGRLGRLNIGGNQHISTPCLFPVVSMVTGTTPRGGGILKHVLQAHNTSLLRRNLPVMTQALHFLNFIAGKPKSFQKWRDIGIRERYNSEIDPSPEYDAPIFFDSGGFQLLWRDQLDLSKHSLSIDRENGWKTIIELQLNLGRRNSIFATLDYPLPPGLSVTQARSRMQASRYNAVQTALYLQNRPEPSPFLYVAAHGRNKRSMAYYVRHVFKEFECNGLSNYPFGLAVGSLVPLRGAGKYKAIVELLQGLHQAIPNEAKYKVPIHVFGVTGSLMPILAYLGIDSFDSSTYIQEARGYSYVNPHTRISHSILGLNEIKCHCCVCQERIANGIDLKRIQDALTAETPRGGQPLADGTYKSEYYGYLALHNLEVDFQLMQITREAIAADCLQDYLIEYVEKMPRLRPTLEAIAQTDKSLKRNMSRKGFLIDSKKIKIKRSSKEKSVSLTYTPKSFNILSDSKYFPPKSKRVLLIIPCSTDKPYSHSHSHRFVQSRINDFLGENSKTIHKVTLSGLYGPVPEEYENNEEILSYNFRLETFDEKQMQLVIERLVEYLQRFHGCYDILGGYATSKAYRIALEKAAQKTNLSVLPKEPKACRLTEMFRQENIVELLNFLNSSIQCA